MKKLISLSLALILIAAVIFAVPVSAADGLSVTADGNNAKTYNVGDELIYTVGLNAGDKAILDGQVVVTYDADKLELIEYKEEGQESAEAYSFPESICNAEITCNYGVAGTIKFNFTNGEKGVGVFNNTEDLFCRFRFKAIAAGSADISTDIQYMIDEDEAKIYYDSKAGDGKNPVMVSDTSGISAGKVKAIVGDVNNSGGVDNRDAMILDRYVAGWTGYDARIVYMDCADMDRKGSVDNRDAMILDRVAAGWDGYYDRYCIEIEVDA